MISSIPWWVGALFVFLLVRGVKARVTQVISLPKLFLIPLIFLVWSLQSLLTRYDPSLFKFGIWFFCLMVGAVFIWYVMRPVTVICDREKGLIQLPGSWSLLVILLTIFFTKFSLGFLWATHPAWRSQFFFYFVDLFVSGGVCGLALGRAISLALKFTKASHIELKER